MKTQKVIAALSDVDFFNNLMSEQYDGWVLLRDSVRQQKTAQGPTIHMCIVEKEIDTKIPEIGPSIPEKDWNEQLNRNNSGPTIKLPTPKFSDKRKETVRIPLQPKPSVLGKAYPPTHSGGHGIKCACPNCTR